MAIGNRMAKARGKPAPSRRRPARPTAVVVVGGSAGGMESLRLLLRDLPASFPAPILAVLHLDPTRPSQAAAVLEGHTRLAVRQAVDGERIRPGTVYLARPDRHLEVHGDRLALTRSARVNFSRPSVDRLFASAAKSCGALALGVVLSGTGFDGRRGAQSIHAEGGTCVVEDPATAEHPGMPQAAAATGAVDVVVPANQLGAYLQHAVGGRRIRVTPAAWKAAATLLKARCHADFGGYRPETLRRRMEARIAITGCATPAQYLAKLRKDAGELEKLRSALLVKVSAFFRDASLWSLLQRRGLARLARDGRREVRMWSAGCATGEEAYTMAMLALSSGPYAGGVKVFGTDLDEPALAKARGGRYPRAALDAVPRALVQRFFRTEGEARHVRPELRRHVVFGRHDLLRDPPLVDMDVVACRNVLIYLKPDERRLVLDRLAGSLRPGGLLFLGKAEGITLPGGDFERVASGAPIFRRLSGLAPAASPAPPATRRPRGARDASPTLMAREPVLLAVGKSLQVTLWNGAAAAFFGLGAQEAIGRPVAGLLPRGAVTQGAIRTAMGKRKRSRLGTVTVVRGGVRSTLSLQAVPFPDGHGLMLMGTPRPAKARAKVRLSAKALPPAARMASEAGPGPHGSLEGQQALNEELQSRNEELETVNEELQSLNDELQVQGDETRRATLFLGALLDSGPDVVIGCDRRGRVSYWGRPAVHRFGLSAAQVEGKDLLQLVPSLDQPALRKLLREGIPKGKSPGRRQVRLADGSQVTVVPALDSQGTRHGVLLRILGPKP